MRPSPPPLRVIDLIAFLQAHDPVAPVEIWIEEDEGERPTTCKYCVREVQQITPLVLKRRGEHYDPLEENPPLPVVVFVA